jgi:protein-S-isoprenylcysteine O-methyltransferase Ste14
MIRHAVFSFSVAAATTALLLFLPAGTIRYCRILTEEGLLLRELKEYREYTRKTKYRLIPGIW